MNRIKTFEQYNIPEGELLSENYADSFKGKVMNFLDNYTDDITMANNLLKKIIYGTI